MEMIKEPYSKSFIKWTGNYVGIAKTEQNEAASASISAQFNQLTASEKSFLDHRAA